jgi:hypothetical protein
LAAIWNNVAVPVFAPGGGRKFGHGSNEVPLFFISCGCWLLRCCGEKISWRAAELPDL